MTDIRNGFNIFVMDNEHGLTGIEENGRGFVGRYNIKFSKTESMRDRMRFDLASGDTDISALKVSTWRKCIAYDDIAVNLRDLIPGDHIRFRGYVKTEIQRDGKQRPVFDKNKPVTIEYLIITHAEILEYEHVQPRLAVPA